MDNQPTGSIRVRPPWSYLLAKWYGYVLALIFLLYGGVSVILGILDRDYTNTNKFLLFFLIGVVLITIAVGFRDRKVWGWYGLLGLHGMVIILALFHPLNPYNWILIILSATSLALLLVGTTKGEIF
jgi:peptidoglycan/LPS O-acetylase OafA/YrhL